jgi:hypothetical protein
MTPSIRERAAEVTGDVANRLTDPRHVATLTNDPRNRVVPDDGGELYSPWVATALSEGHPAVSMLFSELAAHQSWYRKAAREHIMATLREPAPPLWPSLYRGTATLAFAAQLAAHASAGYQGLLTALDRLIASQVREHTSAASAHLAINGTIGAWQGYDLMVGISGMGRYLLERHLSGVEATEAGAALRAVLSLLVAVAVAEDGVVDGVRVPAWWVNHGRRHETGPGTPGHLNLGLAHGVPGPLSLLALAWQADVRIERQDEAITSIVALLDRWRAEDETGPFWPYSVELADHQQCPDTSSRMRDVLCYGSAGIARALYLAGTAVDRSDWVDTSLTALRGSLSTATDHRVVDFSLCHGWAGLLQITHRMTCDTGEADLALETDALAARIIDAFEPGAPFGYRHRVKNNTCGPDRPGFLEGAAGIALALHAYATGRPPLTTWDAALLLA